MLNLTPIDSGTRNITNYLDWDSLKGGLFYQYDPLARTASLAKACREEFSWCRDPTIRWVGYSLDNVRSSEDPRYKPCVNVELVAGFWSRIERKLKLKEESIFYPTERPRIILVYLSPFWLDVACWEVMTLLLRFAVNYYKSDFWEDAKNYKLLWGAKFAVRHFLAGNTRYIGRIVRNKRNSAGVIISTKKEIQGRFHDRFANKPELVRKLFVKPKLKCKS